MAKGSLLKAKGVRPSGYKFPVGLKTNPGLEPNTYINTTNATINAYYDSPGSDPTRVSYSWTSSGTFDHNLGSDLKADVLIVAGGGAGHSSPSGDGGQSGGGAGGLLYYSDTDGLSGHPNYGPVAVGPASSRPADSSYTKTPNGPAVNLASGVRFAVVVGAGGTAMTSPTSDSGNGSDSSITAPPTAPPGTFNNLTATGGGSQNFGTGGAAQPGGSGSGHYGPGSVVGEGIAGQGNPGGVKSGLPGFTGGGGGGAAGPGTAMSDTNLRSGKDGNPAPTSIPDVPAPLSPYNTAYRYASGGDGLDFDISGTRRTYAAGGGGSGRGYANFGGSDNLGGRASGEGPPGPNSDSPWNPGNTGGNGTVNRGSGGGGGTTGGNGGGGIVIIQFRKDGTNFTYSVN